jgi:hypothetical protein
LDEGEEGDEDDEDVEGDDAEPPEELIGVVLPDKLAELAPEPLMDDELPLPPLPPLPPPELLSELELAGTGGAILSAMSVAMRASSARASVVCSICSRPAWAWRSWRSTAT